MGFLNPMLFLFLLSFIPVVILYLLKKEHSEIEVSSTFLWDKVIKDIEVSKPFQKLNKHILLLLQLLVLLFLVLFLVKPFYTTEEPLYSEMVFVIDNSVSMSKTLDEKSLLQLVKEDIKEQISNGNMLTKYTLMTVSSNVENLIQQSNSKSEFLKALESVNETDSADDFGRVLSLVDGFLKADDKMQVIIYTDKALEVDNRNIQVKILSSEEPNVAISNVSHVEMDNAVELLVTIENYRSSSSHSSENISDESVITNGNVNVSGNLTTADLLVFNEGKMIDVKEVNLDNGLINESFVIGDKNLRNITVQLDINDSIKKDNVRYYHIEEERTNKVLLVSERNIYLEKALTVLENVELYKASEITETTRGYDLYVFDRVVPEVLPEDGNLFFINPDKDTDYFTLGETEKYGTVEILDTELSNHLEEKFIIENGTEIVSKDLKSAVLFNGEPIISSGEVDKVRIVVMGFSIFDSDIALKIGFPVLIQNTVDYCLSNYHYATGSVFSSEDVDISLKPTCLRAEVITSDKKVVSVAPPFSTKRFDKTEKVGFYTLKQTLEEGELSTPFVVNIDTSKESSIREYIESDGQAVEEYIGVSEFAKKEFGKVMLIIALIILMIEWGIFRNDHKVY